MKNYREDRVFLYEMARIGQMSEYMIYVRANEGPIPHLHIVDNQTTGIKFNCCIRLDKPEYFSHGNKKDKLNAKLKKEFILFMMEENRELEISNYKTAVIMWNISNPEFRIEPGDIPNYEELR